MSASVSRPPSPLRQAFRASLKALPEEQDLTDALSTVEDACARMRQQINFRVDNNAVGANYTMLDAIRRLGGDLMAAADDYQNGRSS